MSVLDTEVVEFSSPAVGQPDMWTLPTFEVADDRWFVDFNKGERSYVVFSDRVFT